MEGKTDMKVLADEAGLKELAEKQFNEGNYDTALSYFQKLLTEQIRQLGRTHEDTLHTQSRIASVLEKQMKYVEAARTLIKLYQIKLRNLGILNDSTEETRYRTLELVKKHYTTVLTQEISRSIMSAIRLELKIVKKIYMRGKYKEALKSVMPIWCIIQDFFNDDSPIVKKIASIFARIYTAMEHYLEALKVYRVLENVDCQYDRRTATYLMRKASVWHKMCKFDEAMKLYVEAHSIRKNILGLTHKKTLLSLLSIGNIYSDIGNYDQALRIMQQVLDKQEQNHYIESLRTSISIGLLYTRKGQYEEALEVFRKASHVEHASKRTKAMIQNSIGNLLAKLGRYSDARRVLMKIIKTRKSSKFHSDTLSTYRDIAIVLAKEGMLTTARSLLQALTVASDKILGFRHSVSLSIEMDKGLVYVRESRYQDALTIFDRVWYLREQDLGRHHPDTLYSKIQATKMYRRTNQTIIALTFFRQVWDMQKAIFYPQHPDCLTLETEIAGMYFDLKYYNSAFAIIYEMYERKVKMYGADHPYTRKMEEDVARFGRGLPLRRLITATLYENLEDVKTYIELGDDINARDANGAVTLHYASREGCIAILKYLLSKGAIYHITDILGQTPESLATDDVTREVFMLVKSLFVKVKRNNLGEVRRILGRENSIVNAKDEHQRTPLHHAVTRGYEDIVGELLNHGADPLLSNKEDGTVLLAAAKNGDKQVMDILLMHVGLSNPEMLKEFVNDNTNSMGFTALHCAAMQNSAECVDLLIQYNARPTKCDALDRMPFELAKNGRIVEELLMHACRRLALKTGTNMEDWSNVEF